MTTRLEPALRVLEKHGGEHESPPRRRRPAAPAKPALADDSTEPIAHQIDDLA